MDYFAIFKTFSSLGLSLYLEENLPELWLLRYCDIKHIHTLKVYTHGQLEFYIHTYMCMHANTHTHTHTDTVRLQKGSYFLKKLNLLLKQTIVDIFSLCTINNS